MKATRPKELVAEKEERYGQHVKTGVWVVALLCLLTSCQPETPSESGYLSINGSDVFYKTMGAGEPLLIVHGGPVMDHSYFIPHLKALAKHNQLIFYDQRACGRSSTQIDSSTMNLDGFVEDIELIRKALKLDKINLLGHSWGGLLAMKYGIKYNDHLSHLILSNSMAPSAGDWEKEGARVSERATNKDREDRTRIMESGALESNDPSNAIEKLLRIAFRPQMHDSTFLNQIDLYVPKDYMLRSQLFSLLGSDLATFNLYEDLKKITCPTLVIYGSDEPAATLHAQRMTQALGNGKLEIINDSGHFPFVEKKKEFTSLVDQFLGN